MTSRSFDFRLFTKLCFAMGHPSGKVSMCIDVGATPLGVSLSLSAAEARAMAVALEAAATHAENVLPSGLGESAVETAVTS